MKRDLLRLTFVGKIDFNYEFSTFLEIVENFWFIASFFQLYFCEMKIFYFFNILSRIEIENI